MMTKGNAPPAVVEAQAEEGTTRRVAVGDYVLRVDPTLGAIAHALESEGRIRLRPRPTPVDTRPPRFAELQGRMQEIRDAMSARVSHEPIEFVGPAGIGKTTLLRHLVYLVPEELFPSGLLYFSVRHQPLLDVQQALFEVFYHQDIPVRPTESQLRQTLKDKQALIALDDVDLSRDELYALMEAAPRCTFILASLESHLWNEGCAVTLHGLPWRDAKTLIERELDRSLETEERSAAYVLYTSLGGSPLHILRTAAIAREQNASLRSIADLASPAFNAEMLTAISLSSLSDAQGRVLAALAALSGAWVHIEHVSALTGFHDTQELLETLENRHLVEAHGLRYRLTGTLAQDLRSAHRFQALLRARNAELAKVQEPLQELDLDLWSERALNYFASWADQRRTSYERLREETDALVQIVNWGVGASQWPTVLRLTRTVEASFALGGRWGAWERVLNVMYRAAQAVGDRDAQAWALHQLGSRALCLKDLGPVRDYLNQALSIRQDLGDQTGEQITQHNLSLIQGTAEPAHAERDEPAEEPWEPAVPPPVVKALALIAVLVPVALLVWASCVSITRSLPRAKDIAKTSTPVGTVAVEVTAPTTGAATSPAPTTQSSVTVMLPDLTSALDTREEITVDIEGQIRVPIQITIANQGDAPAGDFEVSLASREQSGKSKETELVSLHISSFSATPLAAGAVVTGVGTLVFPPGWQAETLVLGAIADSCIGDPSPPDYCRVNELDETNNKSEPVRIILP